ncbi:MAG: SDR family NAD(P)-dependent oxidoreductase [Actinobacteria bacterium]|nr:MAG: SDR family NAD(P)-dependent oxidoreductase [Actinomycetota bacterium]
MRIDGATAIVTGGSSGIGLSTAELLAARGANVAIVARDPERLEIAAEAVRAARRDGSRKVLAVSCDVSDYDAVTDMVRRVESELGPVDLLMACAGFCTPMRFTELPVEEFQAHIDTNLLGVTYPARAVAPGMMARGRGHIAMVSSMGGFIGVYGYSAYSPAKFGVMGLAEVLRAELKPHGIGVTVLCPPNVDTPGYAREVSMEPAETAKINGGAKTASPAAMAALLVSAVERRAFLVVPGLANALLYRLKGICPELFFAVFDRDIASVRQLRKGVADES